MAVSRHQTLYSQAVIRTARGGRQLHVFHGTGLGFPTSLCGDAQKTPSAAEREAAGGLSASDITVPGCRECRLIALTELSLALQGLGFEEAAIAVSRLVYSASFETGVAMAG